MKLLKEILILLGWIAFLLAIFYGIGRIFIAHGIERHEAAECKKWQEQKETYPGWYATQWQLNQCDHYGVDLGTAKLDIPVENVINNAGRILVMDDLVKEGEASFYDYDLNREDQVCMDETCWSLYHDTCASNVFPKYVTVVVENLENGKQVECWVNDYGPDTTEWPDRIIDLSSHAFLQVGNIQKGVFDAKVWIK